MRKNDLTRLEDSKYIIVNKIPRFTYIELTLPDDDDCLNGFLRNHDKLSYNFRNQIQFTLKKSNKNVT